MENDLVINEDVVVSVVEPEGESGGEGEDGRVGCRVVGKDRREVYAGAAGKKEEFWSARGEFEIEVEKENAGLNSEIGFV